MTQINLNKAFNVFLKGQNFINWANEITDNLLNDSGQNNYVFYLKKFFPILKVKKLIFVNSSINGYIEIEPDGFNIFLSNKLKTPLKRNIEDDKNQIKQIARYKLAHELSHIFFYNINSSPPKSLVHYSQGSPELEYACNVIARCMILPKGLVISYIEGFFERRKNSKEVTEYNLFYLLLSMMQKFNASWLNVLIRVFDDFDSVKNCVFMEFVTHPNIETEVPLKNNVFRLDWIRVSNDLKNMGLFIPFPKNEKVSISARGILKEIIDELNSNLNIYDQIGVVNKILRKKSFAGFGNIDKFICDNNHLDKKLPVFFLITKKSIFLSFCFKDLVYNEAS